MTHLKMPFKNNSSSAANVKAVRMTRIDKKYIDQAGSILGLKSIPTLSTALDILAEMWEAQKARGILAVIDDHSTEEENVLAMIPWQYAEGEGKNSAQAPFAIVGLDSARREKIKQISKEADIGQHQVLSAAAKIILFFAQTSKERRGGVSLATLDDQDGSLQKVFTLSLRRPASSKHALQWVDMPPKAFA